MTSHYREPFNRLHPMFYASYFFAYFSISVFDHTDCPCFEVKGEDDLLLEKTAQSDSTKPVGAKIRVNDYETCESKE